MTMTKKDYQTIAKSIYSCFDVYDDTENKGLREIVLTLSHHLKADNPRFDSERFEQACLTGTCKGMPKNKGGN